MIPNIVHFNYGLMSQDEDFLFVYYVAVLSCKLINTPDKIYFHYHYEPKGYWWDKTKEIVDIIKIDVPLFIGKKPIKKVAHKSDIARMQALKKYGGIYLDIDTICIRSYKDLLHNKFFIGNEITESGKNMGLCNAIMGTEPEGSFITDWWNNYEEHFNPDGWQEASTFLPFNLAKQNKNLTILKPSNFLLPSWESIDLIFEKPNDINEDLIVLHYWNQYSIKKYLPNIKNFDWVVNNTHTLYGKALLNTFSKLSVLEKYKFNFNSLDEIINCINLHEFNKINGLDEKSIDQVISIVKNNLITNLVISKNFINDKQFIGLKTYPVIMHDFNPSEQIKILSNGQKVDTEYKQINKFVGQIKFINIDTIVEMNQNNKKIKIANLKQDNTFYLIDKNYSNKDQVIDIIINPIIVSNDIKILVTYKYIDSTHILIEMIRTDADWGWNENLYLDISIGTNHYLYYVGRNLINSKQIVIETNETLEVVPNYNQKIPKKIFQTWKTNNMTLEMANTIKIIKNLNPEYEYKLFTDNDCIEYIKNNFDYKVVNTFNNLVPGAFKADLFRYCILYKEGGIYIDCKMIPNKPFRQIIKPNDSCILVNNTFEPNSISIYNAFMCSEPNNQIFLECINKIVDYCTNLYYPLDPFAITGPTLLYNIYNKMNLKYRLLSHPNIGLAHTNHNNGIFDESNQLVIYKTYKNYYKNANGGGYIKMFHQGNCYANILDLLTVYTPTNLKKFRNNDFVLVQSKPFDNVLFINQANEYTIDTTIINCSNGLLLVTCDNIWTKLAEIDLTKFSQIYIKAKTFFNESHVCIQNKIEIFKKLNQAHKLIHAHGDNNYETIEINNNQIPSVINLTYLRSDLDTFELNKQQIPSDLDIPINTSKPDISLNFKPFVN